MDLLKKVFITLTLTVLSFCYSFADSTGNTMSLTGGSSTGSSGLIRVEGIDFVDNKTFSMRLSQVLSGISKDSEIKILEDLPVSSSSKDVTNPKKVLVSLNFDLVDGSSYSLVSLSDGLDTSIDFTLIGDKKRIPNTNTPKEGIFIDYINVLDPRNIEVYFNKDLNPKDNIEFKMFKELKVESVSLSESNLNVKMSDGLASKKDYIAILSLKDDTGKDIEVENSLYDFQTPEFSSETLEIVTPFSHASDLASSSSGTGLTSTDSGTGELAENVAMSATQTPDTGLKTSALLALALALSLILFIFTKRKKFFKV